MIISRLLEVGYPEVLRERKFCPDFPVRGLFFDRTYGNLLKVDGYNTISAASHGRKRLSEEECLQVEHHEGLSGAGFWV